MPRVADHDERRASIAEAFAHHVAEQGLATTTYARVAVRAGVSVGLIQHYFASKEDLLRFVYEDALRRRDDRIAAHIAEGEAAERPIRDILGNAVLELLPLDAGRRRDVHITQALLNQALHDPGLAAMALRSDAGLHLRATTAVTNGKQCGEVDVDVDSGAAAARILATVHGLGAQMLLRGPAEQDELPAVQAVLAPLLAGVFTGRCHHYARQ